MNRDSSMHSHDKESIVKRTEQLHSELWKVQYEKLLHLLALDPLAREVHLSVEMM